MELTSLQLNTVKQILDLYNPEHCVTCELKAPTGSGKTAMATYFISSLIHEHVGNNEKFIFVIATPSSSSLPLFFEEKINKYKVDLPYSQFQVEYIKSPSSAKSDKSESIRKIIPEINKVYIFGKATFGKRRILSEYGIIDDFILNAKEKGFKIIYIRDEAHIGEQRENIDETRNFESLMFQNSDFILKMTATPNPNNQANWVVLSENDLNNALLNDGKFLLKTSPVSLLKENLEETELLNNAIEQFKKIKEEYKKLDIGIRPAMLIQVENEPTNKEEKAKFFERLASVKKTLSGANLAWVQYFGNDNKDSNRVYKGEFSLNDITENNNEIDVILFKIGPSTGWDIPRACMLVQLRRVSGEKLHIQTIGRIKRNPYPGLKKHEITDKYYLYSNVERKDENVRIYNYKVRPSFENESLLSVELANEKELREVKVNKEFTSKFSEFLHEALIIQRVKSVFIDNCTVYRRVLRVINNREIYTTITNPFIFLRDYKRLLAANKFLYEHIKPVVTQYCKEKQVAEEFVVTVLLTEYKGQILQILNKTKECKPVFKIVEQVYDPKNYTEIFAEKLTEERVPGKYLFEINSDDPIHKNRQPLDSDPETVVFNQIYNFAEEKGLIKLWAKNQTQSNICGAYLDNNNSVKHSFFDFIVKFKNDSYLYIEVKHEQDINREKTALLTAAYQQYFDNMKPSLFSKKLVIAVWKVDGRGRITSNCFYDKNSFFVDLNFLPAEKLLETLAERQ